MSAQALPTSLPSLRNRLLRHVLLPVAVMWLLASVLVVGIAGYFTLQAFDRALLDDAYLLASHVHRSAALGDDGLELALSAQEINTVLFDQSESQFFAVRRQDGTLLAGNADLSSSPSDDKAAPAFDFLDYRGLHLRAVTLRRDQPAGFYVVMAETTASRDRLMARLLTFSFAPLLVLLAWLALWLMRAVDRDLQPLVALEHAVEQRDAHELTPVPASATTRDVQRLGAAINALLARIAQSVQAQREFAGNVAHELRTPLAGIRALTDYGLHHHDPQVWREQLVEIAQSQERVSHLIDQLLALALADESQHQRVRAPVALDVLVQEAVLRFLPRADALGVDLGARGIDQPVQVIGHAALIEGVLNNLLDNALRYGLAAQGERHITVSVVETEAKIVLSVGDNGPGVSASQREHLTQRWVQGASGEALKQGAGLGLAIVNEYARLMEAEVSVQSETPTGLRVSLSFDRPPR